MNEQFKLTGREKTVLRLIIQDYIKTAHPVGSRQLCKKYKLNVSPATVRNTMSDLEDRGLLTHPHTSAGRIPTDLGYRVYVDALMELSSLSRREYREIQSHISGTSEDIDRLMQKTAQMLSHISQNLGIILAPSFRSGILQHIELISLASNKVLVVVEVQSGLINTVVLEINSSVDPGNLPDITGILNERLAGLSLNDILDTISERCKEYIAQDALLRLIVNEADNVFSISSNQPFAIYGAKQILDQPEFRSVEKLSHVLHLIENGFIIAHFFEEEMREEGINIRIGSENPIEEMLDFSLVSSDYTVGKGSGQVAVVGPKRMDYSKAIALVQYTANSLNSFYKMKEKKHDG